MKYSLFLMLAAFSFFMANGQYYHNDIVATQQANDNYKLLRSNKIRKVTAISKDANNEIVEGFSLLQEMSGNGKELTTTTATSDGVASNLTSYFENGRIAKTEEKSKNVNTIVDYVYDAAGKLQSVASSSIDTVINGNQREAHIWLYDEKGLPSKMLKVKNGSDTTTIMLVYDENGNVGIEQWRKKNRIIETYYYYYDASKRITDIVRFNEERNKMLPDALYEYDATGKLMKMTQVRTAGSNYLVWKYSYNDKGLKATETAFDKKKKLLGTMEYTYN